MKKDIVVPNKSSTAGKSGRARIQKQKGLGVSELKNAQPGSSIQRKSFYKDIVETIREPLLVLDSDLRVIFANRKFYTSFKVTAKNTIGKLVYDLGNQQWDIPKLRVLLEEIIPEKSRFNDYQIEHDFPALGKRIMLLNARRIINPLEKQQLILLAIEDVTDRTLLEQALEVSEERFRRAFETAQDAILLNNKTTGQIMNSNPAAQALLGYSQSELKKLKLWKFEFLKNAEQYHETVRQLKDQGFINFNDTLVRTRNGKKIPADVYFVDKTQLVQCNIRDISERKTKEERLFVNEDRFHELFNNISSGVAVYEAVEDGRDFIIKDFNPAAEKIEKISRAHVIGRRVTEVFPGIREIFLLATFRKVWKTGKALHHPITKYKDARLMGWRENYVYKLPSGEIVAVYEDITERKLSEEKLADEAIRRRILIEQSRDGIVVLDTEGRVYETNLKFAEMLGYSEEEVAGLHVWDWEFKLPKKELMKMIRSVDEAGDHFETQHKRKDGSVYDVEISTNGSMFAGQKLIFCVCRDITERKRIEMDLRESEERFRSLYENATIGMYRTTPGGRVLMANQALVKMLGFKSVNEMTKRNLNKEGFETSSPRKEFQRQIETKGVVHGYESAWKTIMGSTIFVRESAKAIRDKSGKLLYYEGTVEDISERKRAEKTLRESEGRFRGLFEDSPVSLWEEDFSSVKSRLDFLKAEGASDLYDYLRSHPEEVVNCASLIKVLDVNKAALKLYGAKDREHLIKNLAQIVSVESSGKFVEELVNISNGFTRFNYETVNQAIGGSKINLIISWTAAPGHEKDLSRVLISIVDITERKEAEAKMANLIAELRDLSQTEKKNRIFAEALAENITVINSSLRAEEVLDSIINSISGIVPYDAASVMMVNEQQARIVRSKGYREKGLGTWIDQAQFDLNQYKDFNSIIRNKKYKVTPNTETSKEWTVVAETAWIKSHITSPIIENSLVIGFLNLDSATPDYYTEEHAKALMSFSEQVSTALKNARMYEETQRRMNRMQAMTQIDLAINSSLDINVSLEIVLIQAKDKLNADAVDILQVNNGTNSLVFSKAKGFKTDEIRKANFKLGTGLPGRAVLERALIAIPDLRTTPESYFRNLLVEREGFASYYCAPLITKGELKGVMEIYFREPYKADQEWREFLEMLAQQTAIAINNAELLNSLKVSNTDLMNAYETTLKGWVDALDMRDHETEGHTRRVTELSLQLALRIGIKDSEIVNFERGALLHDIGKVGISDNILNKPGPLTEEEWAIMRQHPLYAFQLLSKSKYLIPALDIPYCHHEKWDGSGYPRGLKGEAIPQAARIFAIVDVWDALISDRPYRSAWTQKQVLDYIQEQSGKHFDPKVVTAFLSLPKTAFR